MHCDADLSHADWTAKLRASGWQQDLPTVWVAEGLLYYLDILGVAALLKVTNPSLTIIIVSCLHCLSAFSLSSACQLKFWSGYLRFSATYSICCQLL